MRLGSLFSGAGLGDLGWMMAGFDVQWQVEVDKYCQKVLELRFPESDKYYDIKTFKPKEAKAVDIVVGGVPCQAASIAGKQRGRKDDRWLWPEAIRIIKEIEPRWVVWENVFGLLSLEQGVAFEDICSEMESCGYEVQTFSFTAHSLGASHRRERIWIIAKSTSKRRNDGSDNRKERPVLHDEIGDAKKDKSKGCGIGATAEGRINAQRESKPSGKDVADTNTKGLEGGKETGNIKESRKNENKQFAGCDSIKNYWSTEPSICRVVNGCANRVHRLKALGNGQVVACTAFIGQFIMEFERLRGLNEF